jgi:hypothetical protein
MVVDQGLHFVGSHISTTPPYMPSAFHCQKLTRRLLSTFLTLKLRTHHPHIRLNARSGEAHACISEDFGVHIVRDHEA